MKKHNNDILKLIESTSNELIISDFTPTVVQIMLEYMYKPQLFLVNCQQCSQTQLFELLTLVDKYQITRMSHIVQHQLGASISTTENAYYTLQFADKYNCVYLKPIAVKYIVQQLFWDFVRGGEALQLGDELREEIVLHAQDRFKYEVPVYRH